MYNPSLHLRNHECTYEIIIYDVQMTDQGICQSSWAFSAAGATDGRVFVMTGSLMETSVQQLLDCSFSFGNRGCHGGIPTWAYKYIESAAGVCPSQNYPYLGYVSELYTLWKVLLL